MVKFNAVCKICGSSFVATHNTTVICSKKCKDEAKRISIKKCKEKEEKKREKRNKEIIDIAVAAREAGMTYGQYVGLMYMRKE